MNDIKNTVHDEINIKDVIKTVGKYKYLIFLITFIFVIMGGIFAYMKPNIYSTNIVMEITENKKSNAGADFMMEALAGGSSANLSNEIEIIKSSLIMQKAISSLDLNISYFSKKNFKNLEYYKNSPFIVKINYLDKLLYNRSFTLTPIDENTFNLQIKQASSLSISGILKKIGISAYSESEKIVYDKDHNFNEEIDTDLFKITINKVYNLDNKEYSFKFSDNYTIYNSLKNSLTITQVSKGATILNVSIEGTNANRIKDILDAVYIKYKEEDIQRKNSEANLTLNFIDEQLSSINKNLNISATNLETFKEKNQFVELSDQAMKSTEQLSKYEGQVEELKTELNILLSLKEYIKSNTSLVGISITSVNFIDPTISSLLVKLQEETARKDSLLIDYTPIHPDIIKVNQNIKNLKNNIKITLDNNINQILNRKDSLDEIIAKYSKSITSLPKQEREYSKLTRLFKIDENIYSYLLQKKAESAILKSSTMSNTRLLDEGIINYNSIKPKRLMIVMISFILGLIVSLAYVFIREFFNNTISNSDDIERLSSVPIYGIVPEYKSQKSKKLVEEAYRSIRTNLQFLPKHEKSNVIAITSSVSGEGKTITTSNLAKVIAQSNKSVVVLDLDLRKSSVHKDFNLPNVIGISNYLSGQNTLDEITNFVVEDNVSVLTTGPLPPNPSELILGDKMKELIAILKEKYDYVLFDTPPVGLVTDAMILVNYADITFLVARAFYTRKEFVKNLDRLASEHHLNSFGIILNGVEIGEKYGYGYGSNYGYGYGNSKYYQDR